ncbi:MAG TPA: glycosyltransferase family 4 protein [Candidatus Acidoferrum sp.]|nr:glycosyltransferase family 4 protein [Candidatus Acidoferrum sp.]
MKVLFCALGIYSSVGGIQRFNQRVVTCLAELRSAFVTKPTVLVLWDEPRDRCKPPKGVKYLPCARHKVYMLLRFVWTVLRERPDVIVYGHTLLGPMAIIARLLVPRTQQALFVHGVEVWGRPKLFERKIVERFMHCIVSVSQFTAVKMRQAYGLDSNKFFVLPNAIDLKLNGQMKRPVETAFQGKHRLLTVARLEDRYKGHDKVISSMLVILARFPETHYYIVGDGPLVEELRMHAEKAGVAANVHFLGYVDDSMLDAVYQNCDIFILPSKGEGFGIVFLEAWEHRLPVIAGNQDGSAEVIQDGVNGLLVCPDRLEEISAAVVGLLADSSRRLSLGEAGYKSLSCKHTHVHFRERLADALRSLAKIRDGTQCRVGTVTPSYPTIQDTPSSPNLGGTR